MRQGYVPLRPPLNQGTFTLQPLFSHRVQPIRASYKTSLVRSLRYYSSVSFFRPVNRSNTDLILALGKAATMHFYAATCHVFCSASHVQPSTPPRLACLCCFLSSSTTHQVHPKRTVVLTIGFNIVRCLHDGRERSRQKASLLPCDV